MLEVFKLVGTLAINGTDKANKEIDGVTGKAESAGSKIGSVLGNVGGAVVKMGAVVGAGIATVATGIGVLTKQSVDSYAEYEQLVGGAELMFGEAYGYIAEQAKNAYATVQMSQNDYLEQVNGFAVGLKTALGGNEQASAELAHKIITAEADIVSATGNSQEAVQNAFNGIMKSNFTMLDNLQIGIKPTKEGMQEVIDKVNEWNEAQGNATSYTIDNLADCQSALVDYIEMQGLAGYASAEASGTIQGSVAMMKASWENFLTGMANDETDFGSLSENLINSIVTVADNLVPRLVQTVPKIVQGLSTVIQNLVPYIPELISTLVPALIEGATTLLTELSNNLPAILEALLPNIGGELGNAIVMVLSSVMDLIKEILPPLMQLVQQILPIISQLIETLLPPLMQIVQMILPLLISVISALLPAIQPLLDLLQPILDLLLLILEPIIQLLNVLLPPLIEVFTAIVETIVSYLQPAFEILGEVISALMPIITNIVELAGQYFSNMAEQITLIFSGIQKVITVIWGSIKSVIMTIVTFIKTNVIDRFTALKDGAIEVFNMLHDGVKAIFDGIWSFVKTTVNNIISGVETMCNGVIRAINKLLEGIEAIANEAGELLGFDPISISLDEVSLPRLAKGGILAKGQVGLLEGDGAEAVVPLDQNKKWISSVANDMETAGIGGGSDTLDVMKQMLAVLQDLRDDNASLPETLVDAMAGNLTFAMNNREFARLVKAVN